ncbi:MAG: GTP-binding protein [Planctomycetes bacterium]|nr:GTP-binding protein [Planctomycetota bacterium]
MYEIRDTISAISSALGGLSSVGRTIVRVSGGGVGEIVAGLTDGKFVFGGRGVKASAIVVDGISVDAAIYSFPGPCSYTGEDIAEFHFYAGQPVVEAVLQKVLEQCRLAGPGEFTLRAYLNGKIDLSQAEAVSQIVSSSNKFQLSAAEKLLAGKLCESIGVIGGQLLDIMSLIEAGLDFSEEDIELVSGEKAAATIREIASRLQSILDSSLRYEELIDIPAVGLAGAANAGKSSLMNAMLSAERSIISDEFGTTRDVLTEVLEMDKSRCAIFDCAGLGCYRGSEDVLDRLGQGAALAALNAADLVIFCADVSKDDYSEDVSILNQIAPKELMLVLTKSDQVSGEAVVEKTAELEKLFSTSPVVTSVVDETTIMNLRAKVQERLILQTAGSEIADRIAINERHRSAVNEAIMNISDGADEVLKGNDEVAAMFLRTGYEALAGIEREDIDEAILDRIFSSFCIGK